MSKIAKPIILVPVDFSHTSERGLEHAAGLARKIGARLVLLHVVEYHPANFSPEMPVNWCPDAVVRKSEEDLARLAKERAGEDIEVECFVHTRPLASREIVEYAERICAEMIVMGTHGRRGLSRFFLGSCAEDVVRRAPCPVMTVGPLNEADPKSADPATMHREERAGSNPVS